jgi:RNA recognition motif-containing protein
MQKESSAEQRTIYVSKIPKSCDKESLSLVFGEFGTVMRLDLPTDKKNGEHKGIAFVEYQTEEEMLNAMQKFAASEKSKMVLKPFKPKQKSEDKNSSTQSDESNNQKAKGIKEPKPKEPKANIVDSKSNDGVASKAAKKPNEKKTKQKKEKKSNNISGEQKGKETLGREVPITPDSVYDGQEAWAGRSRSNSKSQPMEWEPNPSTAGQRPKQRYLIGQMEAGKVLFVPSRNPLGPSGDGRGFSAGRGKIIAQ